MSKYLFTDFIIWACIQTTEFEQEQKISYAINWTTTLKTKPVASQHNVK